MSQHDLEDLMELGVIGLLLVALLAPLWMPLAIWRAFTRD